MDTPKIARSDTPSMTAYKCRPGAHSEFARDAERLFDMIARVDEQLDLLNQVMNGIQPPANGKLGIIRDAPKNGLNGYPRLAVWRRASSNKWMSKGISNSHMTKRAKSTPPFDGCHNMMTAVLHEVDTLMDYRKSLIKRLTDFKRILAALDIMDEKLNTSIEMIGVFNKDMEVIKNSKWKIKDDELGY